MDLDLLRKTWRQYKTYAGVKLYFIYVLLIVALTGLLFVIVPASIDDGSYKALKSAYVKRFHTYSAYHPIFAANAAKRDYTSIGVTYQSELQRASPVQKAESDLFGHLTPAELRAISYKVAPYYYWAAKLDAGQSRPMIEMETKALTVKTALIYGMMSASRVVLAQSEPVIRSFEKEIMATGRTDCSGIISVTTDKETQEKTNYCLHIGDMATHLIYEVDADASGNLTVVSSEARWVPAKDFVEIEDGVVSWPLGKIKVTVVGKGCPYVPIELAGGFPANPMIGTWVGIGITVVLVAVIAIIYIDHLIRRNTELDADWAHQKGETARISAPTGPLSHDD